METVRVQPSCKNTTERVILATLSNHQKSCRHIQQLRDSTWWTGPTWLADENKLATDTTLKKTKEVSEEHRVTVQKLHTIVMKENNLNDLLVKWNLWKVLRIVAWIFRFVSNTTKRGKTKGVLTTNEINHAETFWIKLVQEEAAKEENHSAIASKLGLDADEKGALRCKGRIIGEHPVYLPRNPISLLESRGF